MKFIIPFMDSTESPEFKHHLTALTETISAKSNDDDVEPEETQEHFPKDECCESLSDESNCSNSEIEIIESATSNLGRSEAMNETPTVTVSQPYVVTYLPTSVSNSIAIRSEGDTLLNSPNCVTIASSQAQAQNQPTHQSPTTHSTLFTDATANALNTATGTMTTNNRIFTVPVTTSPSIVNYFLMDVAMQMERLNDIAQMELKIEIHRLLLEKLKNVNNLRQSQSICFATPTNPN